MKLGRMPRICPAEATSALDIEGEKSLAALIDAFAAGKTRVVVSHDLSTIENADKILVLDQGRIVDEGAHGALKERCVLYQNLLEEGKEEA